VDDKGRVARAFGVPKEELQPETTASAIAAEELSSWWMGVFLPTAGAIEGWIDYEAPERPGQHLTNRGKVWYNSK